ncbi:Inhibitor of sigma-G Gin, partial [Dysosmobacter welbionis]
PLGTALHHRNLQKRWPGVRLCPRRYRHTGLGTVCRRTESGKPRGIGVPVPGMGNGARPDRTHW